MESMEPARKDYKKRTSLEKELDAAFFLKYHKRKYSYLQISLMWMQAHPGYTISKQSVFNSIKRQTKDWKDANQDFITREKMMSLQVLNDVQQACWEMLDRSREDSEKISITRSYPSFSGGGGRDEEFVDDEQKLMRVQSLMQSMADEDGLPPISKQVKTIEGQSGDSSLPRVIAYCEKLRMEIMDSLTVGTQLNPALIAIAKAMGVPVGGESDDLDDEDEDDEA